MCMGLPDDIGYVYSCRLLFCACRMMLISLARCPACLQKYNVRCEICAIAHISLVLCYTNSRSKGPKHSSQWPAFVVSKKCKSAMKAIAATVDEKEEYLVSARNNLKKKSPMKHQRIFIIVLLYVEILAEIFLECSRDGYNGYYRGD